MKTLDLTDAEAHVLADYLEQANLFPHVLKNLRTFKGERAFRLIMRKDYWSQSQNSDETSFEAICPWTDSIKIIEEYLLLEHVKYGKIADQQPLSRITFPNPPSLRSSKTKVKDPNYVFSDSIFSLINEAQEDRHRHWRSYQLQVNIKNYWRLAWDTRHLEKWKTQDVMEKILHHYFHEGDVNGPFRNPLEHLREAKRPFGCKYSEDRYLAMAFAFNLGWDWLGLTHSCWRLPEYLVTFAMEILDQIEKDLEEELEEKGYDKCPWCPENS